MAFGIEGYTIPLLGVFQILMYSFFGWQVLLFQVVMSNAKVLTVSTDQKIRVFVSFKFFKHIPNSTSIFITHNLAVNSQNTHIAHLLVLQILHHPCVTLYHIFHFPSTCHTATTVQLRRKLEKYDLSICATELSHSLPIYISGDS